MKIPGIVFNKQITYTCVLFVSDLDLQKDRYLKDVYRLKGYKRPFKHLENTDQEATEVACVCVLYLCTS